MKQQAIFWSRCEPFSRGQPIPWNHSSWVALLHLLCYNGELGFTWLRVALIKMFDGHAPGNNYLNATYLAPLIRTSSWKDFWMFLVSVVTWPETWKIKEFGEVQNLPECCGLSVLCEMRRREPGTGLPSLCSPFYLHQTHLWERGRMRAIEGKRERDRGPGTHSWLKPAFVFATVWQFGTPLQ